MSEQEFNKIFARNLSFQLEISGHTQADLAKYIGVSTASVSNWCKGIKLPRMDKVDRICSFFHIKRSDLMEDKSSEEYASHSSIPSHALTPDEAALLADYQRLNDTGKGKAREYVSDLAEQKKYTEDTESLAEINIA